jgi:hypothetical protein
MNWRGFLTTFQGILVTPEVGFSDADVRLELLKGHKFENLNRAVGFELLAEIDCGITRTHLICKTIARNR